MEKILSSKKLPIILIPFIIRSTNTCILYSIYFSLHLYFPIHFLLNPLTSWPWLSLKLAHSPPFHSQMNPSSVSMNPSSVSSQSIFKSICQILIKFIASVMTFLSIVTYWGLWVFVLRNLPFGLWEVATALWSYFRLNHWSIRTDFSYWSECVSRLYVFCLFWNAIWD